MIKVCPEKTTFFMSQPVIVFKSGREKSLPTSNFMKWIVKNGKMEEIKLKLREFRYNHPPSGMKMLAKFARRGIRV
jgi:hypothetical protein